MTKTIAASFATNNSRRTSSRTRLHRVSLDSSVVVVVADRDRKKSTNNNNNNLPEEKVVSTTPMKRKQSSITTPTSITSTESTVPITTVESKDSFLHYTNDDNNNTNRDDEEDDPNIVEVYHFNGVNYTSYQDMVHAKRQRNQQILEQSGLLTISSASSSSSSRRSSNSYPKTGSQRGLQANNARNSKDRHVSSSSSSHQQGRRKSSRILGIESDGLYIDEERAGRVTVAGATSNSSTIQKEDDPTSSNSSSNNTGSTSLFYRNRINDGTPLSLSEAIEQAGTKWMTETSIADATSFVQDILRDATAKISVPSSSNDEPIIVPTASNRLLSYQYDLNHVNALECDDIERSVAKVCPDRIYSMTVHPSSNHLIVSAGDKLGHVGIWNVNDNYTPHGDHDDIVNRYQDDATKKTTAVTTNTNQRDGVHLFKPHTGAVCSLQWTGNGASGGTSGNPHHLISASYDGTIRMLDVQQEQFIEIFATYDNNNDPTTPYQHRPGYGIEQEYGSKFWTQHITLDPRYNESTCFFLATSVGTAMHIDLRSKHSITFHEQFSEKKINSLSLHPNGYSLISGGLDNMVALWDVRTLGNSLQAKRTKSPEPLAYYNCGRSINSVYFSPSGKYAVSTTMANKLDIFEDLHLGVAVNRNDGSKKSSKNSSSNNTTIQPKNSVRHDNMTGRWLTTFQAVFHPQLDLFVVGSMRQPRCIELFDPAPTSTTEQHGRLIRTVQGNGITAVVSRLAFHPRMDQLIVCGGNSSGRVTIVRQ